MKIYQQIIWPLNIALILSITLGDICYITLGGTLVKGLTSGLFVLLGLVNLAYVILQKRSLKFPIIMTVGLVFAMLGDILLNVEFIVGAIFFAIGHVWYFVAYSFIAKFKPSDLIYGVAIFVPSVLFILLMPIFDFDGVLMQIVCVVYALIISFMVGKALANLIAHQNCRNILLAVGSILFFFSDLMLLLNVFGNHALVFDVLCLATYYPAECLLGLAIFAHKGDNQTMTMA